MVLDSNASPYNNFDRINSDSISKIPDPDTSSHHQNLNFHSLFENPELPSQGKGKEVAMASSSSSTPVFHQFLQLKSERSGKLELEEGEKKIISFPLNANPVRKISCPQLPTIAEMTTLSENAGSSEDLSFSKFSHNPSCSLTRSSTENDSIDQQAWNAEEETVYGKFRPHGFTFASYIDEVKEINNNKIDDELIYPLELPAIAGKAVDAALSLENETPDDVSFGLRSERLLKDIARESVPHMKQVLLQFDSESLNELKNSLKSLMEAAEKKDKFVRLQKRLEGRYDLTEETLAKANRVQLEIMVAIKTAVVDFLTIKSEIPRSELVEIFTMTRCKNLNCKMLIPVDDCECEVCTRGIGFCRECMCMVCTEFDCATNTCTWVGCWMCSHWCHALCAFEKNLFKPGPTQKLGNGATEIQFVCPQCAYASEIFGFVKDVFTTCGKTWGVETLMKELDCVRRIFHLSEDPEGKELEKTAVQMLTKLHKKKISAADACEAIVKFFNYGVSDHSTMGASSSNPIPTISLPETQVKPVKPKPTPTLGLNQEVIKNLETNIRLKEAEANLFQRLADEARKELETYLMFQQAATKEKNMHLQQVDAKKRKDPEEHYQAMEGKSRHVAKMRKRAEATKKEME